MSTVDDDPGNELMLRRRFRYGVLEKIPAPAGGTFQDLGPIEFCLGGALPTESFHVLVRDSVLVSDRRLLRR